MFEPSTYITRFEVRETKKQCDECVVFFLHQMFFVYFEQATAAPSEKQREEELTTKKITQNQRPRNSSLTQTLTFKILLFKNT